MLLSKETRDLVEDNIVLLVKNIEALNVKDGQNLKSHGWVG